MHNNSSKKSTLANAKGDYGYGSNEPIRFKLVNNGKVQFMCYRNKEITWSI